MTHDVKPSLRTFFLYLFPAMLCFHTFFIVETASVFLVLVPCMGLER